MGGGGERGSLGWHPAAAAAKRAVARQGLGDARDPDDVGADAVDHACQAAGGAFAHQALHLAHRLAHAENTERLTMEWPMCSSRMPGRRAIGWTL